MMNLDGDAVRRIGFSTIWQFGHHMMHLDGYAVRRIGHMMFPAGLVPWSWAFRHHRWDEVRGW